jgi:hypothetical protein
MSNQPRKHHYVPQFYLAGFTASGTVEGDLHVVDTTLLKSWVAKPKDAAHKRDFHKVETSPTNDAMTVEKNLGELEGKWSGVLRKVLEQHSLPNDEDFADLMVFIAFMAVRVPRIRDKTSDFLDEVRKKEDFAREWLKQQGQCVDPAPATDFGEFDQTWHVRNMICAAIDLAPLLSLRIWNLWVAEDHAPDLICSDCPVAPRWASPVQGPYSPAFGTLSTIVSLPLSKRMAMVSMLEVNVGTRTLGRNEVAQLNSATAMYARQLYCPESDFVWVMTDGQVGQKADLLHVLRRSRDA